MFCMNCGAKNRDNARFCAKCGKPIEEVAVDGTTVPAAKPEPVEHPEQPAAQSDSRERANSMERSDSVAHADAADGTNAVEQTDKAAQTAAQTESPAQSAAAEQSDRQQDSASSAQATAPPMPVPASASDEAAAPASAPSPQPTGPMTVPLPGGGPTTPVPAPDPAQSSGAGTATIATAAGSRRTKLTMLIIAAVVAVALLASGGAFLTYRAGWWGEKVVPNIEEFQPPAGQKLTANIVAKQLKSKGIRTEVRQVYSGKSKGEFVDLGNYKSGDRIKSGQTVTVNESMGPGVPKGTVGQSATSVVKTLKDMGVPVRYKQVIVSDTSTYKAGSVVTTSPSDGSALSDSQTGIEVGVATKGNGIGYDIIGMDKDAAQSALAAQGYSVTLKPRFSSKQYLGKISYSDPAPGTPLSSGDKVTLYYGVDSSQVKTLFTEDMSGQKVTTPRPGDYLTGTYCKADNSKCFELGLETEGSSDFKYLYKIGDDADTSRMLTASRSFQSAGPAPGMTKDGLLINGDTGAFELFTLASAMGGMYCGDKPMGDSIGTSCVNGQVVEASGSSYANQSGLTQRMDEFYLYFPVGADIKAVESSNYFDADALAKARKQKAVDADRPFIVVRDKSLYDKSQTEISRSQFTTNPFLPSDPTAYEKTDSVKMKPAPSNDTAYYLVEGGELLDWDSLPDASVDQGTSDSGKSSDSSTSGASGTNGESAKILAELAGSEYSFAASGDGSQYSTMALKSDGSFSGTTYTANLSGGDSVATAPRDKTKFSGRFKSATKNSDGTYTLQCDADVLQVGNQTEAIQAGFDPCGKFVAYPAGTSYDTFRAGPQTVLRNRGESESGPHDWLIVNMGVADESITGTYERTKQ